MPTEATTTIRATTADFDRIRKALETSRAWCFTQSENNDLPAADRRGAREEAALYAQLLAKLNGS